MEYISYCGLLCNECPVYIATAENNEEAQERIATEFSGERMQFTKEEMNCYGRSHEETKNSKMCSGCEIRICAESKEVKNCAYCKDFTCDKINQFIEKNPDLKRNLEESKKEK